MTRISTELLERLLVRTIVAKHSSPARCSASSLQTWKWVIAMCLGGLSLGDAFAQARETAQRDSEIAPFALGSAVRGQYHQSNDSGFVAGVDLTPFMFREFQPSLEIRVTGDFGSIAQEYTYSGGLKAATRVGRIHPYATLLRGLDTIYFTHPASTPKGLYSRDSSRMFSIGGGVSLDLGSTWQLDLDFSKQYWALNSPNVRPNALSAGITYRIPFGESKMRH